MSVILREVPGQLLAHLWGTGLICASLLARKCSALGPGQAKTHRITLVPYVRCLAQLLAQLWSTGSKCIAAAGMNIPWACGCTSFPWVCSCIGTSGMGSPWACECRRNPWV